MYSFILTCKEEEHGKKLQKYALRSSKAKGKYDHLESEDDQEIEIRKYLRYKIDSSRIIFSRTFRRLAGKTQVFWRLEHDLPRSRLSHSLEVAEMSAFVARFLGLNQEATMAMALGHDLGHTPFGHSGERALRKILFDLKNRLKKEQNIEVPIGRFDHNWQSVRAAEIYYTGFDFFGFNLSHDIREGILKHDPPKKYKFEDPEKTVDKKELEPHSYDELGYYPGITKDDVENLYLGPEMIYCSSIEGQLVRIIDKISSATHDIEDAHRMRILSRKEIERFPIIGNILTEKDKGINALYKKAEIPKKFRKLKIIWTGYEDDTKVREACHKLRIFLTNDLIENTLSKLAKVSYDLSNNNDEKLIEQRKEIAKQEYVKLGNMNEFGKLKNCIDNTIINSDLINEADAIAERVIDKLFQSYYHRPLLLPKNIIHKFKLSLINHKEEEHEHENPKVNEWHQQIGAHDHKFNINLLHSKKRLSEANVRELQKEPIFCRLIVDYIAGMTDRFALEKARELY